MKLWVLIKTQHMPFFNNSLQSANVINLNPQEMIYIISDLVNNSIGQVLERVRP